FFSCHVPPPALHSFPTRRSSDLALLVRRPAVGQFLGLDRAGEVDLELERLLGVLVLAQDQGQRDREPAQPVRYVVLARVAARPEDRKSTRLNSSHDQISYAVFCL